MHPSKFLLLAFFIGCFFFLAHADQPTSKPAKTAGKPVNKTPVMAQKPQGFGPADPRPPAIAGNPNLAIGDVPCQGPNADPTRCNFKLETVQLPQLIKAQNGAPLPRLSLATGPAPHIKIIPNGATLEPEPMAGRCYCPCSAAAKTGPVDPNQGKLPTSKPSTQPNGLGFQPVAQMPGNKNTPVKSRKPRPVITPIATKKFSVDSVDGRLKSRTRGVAIAN